MAYSLPLQSVTNKPHPPPGGDLHDYTSYSSYFWPCTAKCNTSLFANCTLWGPTSDGRSVRGAVEWAAPFADGRLPWTAGEQIRPFEATAYGRVYRASAIGFAGDSERRFAAIAAKQPGAGTSREWLLRPYPSQ